MSYSEQSRPNGHTKLRSDYRAAVLMKNRLHHESGEPSEEPIHPGQQRRNQQGQEVFSKITYFSSARVGQHTGWEYWLHLQVPRGGTHLNGVGSELTIFTLLGFFRYSWFRLQLVAIHCNRRGVWTEHPHTRLSQHFQLCAHITLWLKATDRTDFEPCRNHLE